MDENDRQREALFRLGVLGDLVHVELQHGELKPALQKKASQLWKDPNGKPRKIKVKTLQTWYYNYRKLGFAGLLPKERSDKGRCKAIAPELQSLIVDMKREDPGRSVPLIIRELEGKGLVGKGDLSDSTVGRLLAREGLSGPKMELEVPARYRFVAATCGELWQGDACHAFKLFDPSSGREIMVKIFGLIDDKSRLVPYLRGSFHETQQDFLRVLLAAIQRRGIPRTLLLDNHGSFTGEHVQLACAKLGIRLVHARPYDGPAKGKQERFWRTLRAHVLDRLDREKIVTLDDLNLRLMAWVESEYNQRPHSGLSGRTPLSVFEEDAEEIRWVEDRRAIEAASIGSVQRWVRNDSTCTILGRVYEVPTHLRGRHVEIFYSLLDSDHVWIHDDRAQVFLRIVDAVGNSRRPRTRPAQTDNQAPSQPTGLNAIEDALKRLLRPESADGDEPRDGEEAAGHA
jgi:transposase InsO family protein